MLGMVHQEHAADFLFRSVEVCTNASVKCKELADGRGKNGYFIFGIGQGRGGLKIILIEVLWHMDHI